jgi:hypothetical protein
MFTISGSWTIEGHEKGVHDTIGVAPPVVVDDEEDVVEVPPAPPVVVVVTPIETFMCCCSVRVMTCAMRRVIRRSLVDMVKYREADNVCGTPFLITTAE